jgi:hypothetical protein
MWEPPNQSQFNIGDGLLPRSSIKGDGLKAEPTPTLAGLWGLILAHHSYGVGLLRHAHARAANLNVSTLYGNSVIAHNNSAIAHNDNATVYSDNTIIYNNNATIHNKGNHPIWFSNE